MVDFAIPLLRRGAGAFIVSVVGHSYLISLLPLLLIMPSYLSTMPVVLAVRRAPASEGVSTLPSKEDDCVRAVGPFVVLKIRGAVLVLLTALEREEKRKEEGGLQIISNGSNRVESITVR
ncbi:hypothetical protein BHE74_00021245 [Ensete ventricosum]|nr:hypothetical protein BHE74_00021245 [Ensete ventricosum]RZR90777.1 hypothetical protein BHM03_00018742 [Ensete ventricosum]